MTGLKTIFYCVSTTQFEKRSLQLAKENEVILIFLPPNSTKLLQPLDVTYFASIKTFWREILQQWRETRQRKVTVAMPKLIFTQLLKKTLDLGIVLSQLPAFAQSDNTINNSIGEEFQKYLKNIGRVILVLLKDQESIVFLLNQKKVCLVKMKFKSCMKTET
ncbi:hypothetical protein PR048_027931 [Dryococelus australis]|uniref:DDE-1 domain-containing protein n=1 Tax=Dryococelus australis TaxID=614101 RepID=A0ABQ9GHU2_9NEOP|nr:hypothetical protein PR048_027931 [Dryococelus australis]